MQSVTRSAPVTDLDSNPVLTDENNSKEYYTDFPGATHLAILHAQLTAGAVDRNVFDVRRIADGAWPTTGRTANDTAQLVRFVWSTNQVSVASDAVLLNGLDRYTREGVGAMFAAELKAMGVAILSLEGFTAENTNIVVGVAPIDMADTDRSHAERSDPRVVSHNVFISFERSDTLLTTQLRTRLIDAMADTSDPWPCLFKPSAGHIAEAIAD